MPTRTLRETAAARGLSLEQLAEVLQPVAREHFGPRVRVELSVEAERPQLFSAFRIEAKAVPEVITALFGSDAIALACEGSDVTPAQLAAAFAARDVHLARRTAFRTRVERLVGEGKPGLLSRFAQLVGSERDARFIP